MWFDQLPDELREQFTVTGAPGARSFGEEPFSLNARRSAFILDAPNRSRAGTDRLRGPRCSLTASC